MKKFLSLISLVVLTMVCKSQTVENPSGITQNLKAANTATHFELSWQTSVKDESNYWEVQSSPDGKTFSTIGLVLGGKESETGLTFNFKQKNKDLRAGHKYYRVLHVVSNTDAVASPTVSLSK